MLLTVVRDEFAFQCQCRKLSPRTIKNYTKQIDYLLRFLAQEKKTTHIEDGEESLASRFTPPHRVYQPQCRGVAL